MDVYESNCVDANHLMELNSGSVFCIPADEKIALPKELMDAIIDDAIAECERRGIKGKDITPFLLASVKEATGGQSVKTNVEFVKNNARIGARIAVALAALEVGVFF
ncbi:hypothetical protein AWJ20_1191 [Sugiyamaella lignohabitans]|uniref:Pseudouridine-5'-phosphate glycosidase n=1 Tax=Sugiyamaella lignohabitans TaxID=796027 RepID=A0A167DH45_9ASCO|nr:uncharacterized protein AWJ20_1191 [Sugiyamaella lignohabitans]ANB12913.1 hypothetical protein AWJ20_1191 [Sugiyamaella lignohabitans]